MDDKHLNSYSDFFDGAAGPGVLASDPSLLLQRILQVEQQDVPYSQPLEPQEDIAQQGYPTKQQQNPLPISKYKEQQNQPISQAFQPNQPISKPDQPNQPSEPNQPISQHHHHNDEPIQPISQHHHHDEPNQPISQQHHHHQPNQPNGQPNELMTQTDQLNQPISQPIDVSEIINDNGKDQNVFGFHFIHSLNSLSARNVNGAEDVAVSDAMSAFGFNAIIFVILIGIYELFSRFVPSVYASRRLYVPESQTRIDIPQSALPLSWLPTILRTNWASVRKCGGLDAYFFLRFIRLCMRITLVSGLWGMIVLCPVFAGGGANSEGWYYFSMANVTQGTGRIWFPAAFMWFLTFYVLFAMKEEYKHYLELRMQYLAEGDANMNPQTQHSLIIEDIPRELRSDKALYAYFDALFPGKIHSTSVVLNIPDLEKISAKRNRAVRRLEKSIAYFEATAKRLTHVIGRKRLMCCGIETYPIRNFGGRVMVEEDDNSSPQKGERVDSINYYTIQLVDLNDSVEKIQKEKIALAMVGSDSVKTTLWFSRMIEIASSTTTNMQKNSFTDKMIYEFKNRKGICGFIRQFSLDFFFGGFTFLNRNIDAVVESVSGSTTSSTGFVTFDDLATVACAAKAPLCHDPNTLIAAFAPDPRDIQWENTHVNYSYSKGREWTANCLLVIGAILWSIPVASIQALATAEKFAKAPGFIWINSLTGGRFNSFIIGYLPVVALLAIISVLPYFFEMIALKFESRKTKSNVQQSILERYFYYQLANIYITVTAGSIWTALGSIIDHPGSGLEILAKSVPKVVGYFVTLLMTKTLAGLPLDLLRISSLVRFTFLNLCFKQSLLTQRELSEVHKPQALLGGFEYPNQLLVIVICFTYACISPIILPVGALYFLIALIVYKKQILLLYVPDHESGGSMFPSACHRTLIGLICGQLTLIGYMILREAYYQPFVLLPLPVFTTLVMRSFAQEYDNPSAQLSLERAKDLDHNSMVRLQFTENLYRQPVLTEGKIEPSPYRIRKNPERMELSSPRLGVFHDDAGKFC